MKVGDLVTIDDTGCGPCGIVVELVEVALLGQHSAAVRVLIEGEIVPFDSRDLWRFYESR